MCSVLYARVSVGFLGEVSTIGVSKGPMPLGFSFFSTYLICRAFLDDVVVVLVEFLHGSADTDTT